MARCTVIHAKHPYVLEPERARCHVYSGIYFLRPKVLHFLAGFSNSNFRSASRTSKAIKRFMKLDSINLIAAVGKRSES